MLVADADSFTTAGLRRAVVEAHDRLGDRLLQRLGTVREDIDADLSELRSDIGALREAVESVGGVAGQRGLGESLQELRNEIAGLRMYLVGLADQVLQAIGDVSVPPLESGPLVNELEALRSEITSLRRRISLRVASEQQEIFDDAVIATIAEAVAERLRPVSKGQSRR